MVTISPANSCPITSGGLSRPRPRVPVGDVEVGAAHARMAHCDEDLTGAGGGLGTLVTFKPGAGFSLTIACMRIGEEGRGKGQNIERVKPPSTWSTAPVI